MFVLNRQHLVITINQQLIDMFSKHADCKKVIFRLFFPLDKNVLIGGFFGPHHDSND